MTPVGVSASLSNSPGELRNSLPVPVFPTSYELTLLNPFITMPPAFIYSAYYLLILYGFLTSMKYSNHIPKLMVKIQY